MPHQTPGPGFNSAMDYTPSGIPWVTSSIVTGIVEFNFPSVTRSVTVRNGSTGGSVRLAFTRNGLSTGRYFDLENNVAISEELRCSSLFVSGSGASVSVLCGLTPILTASMGFVMTGSGGSVVFSGMG